MSVPATMRVTKIPSMDLTMTNLAYCSPADLHHFADMGTELFMALLADRVILNLAYPFKLDSFFFFFRFLYNQAKLIVEQLGLNNLTSHQSVERGHIALNGAQRRCIKVSSGDEVSVSRFIPPNDFDLALLKLKLEFVKKEASRTEQVDAVVLSNHLKKIFMNQVMSSGQRVTFEYHMTAYIFTVNQVIMKGQENSGDVERGMISIDTSFIFEAANTSSIKFVNQHEAASSNILKGDVNPQSLGIGGLGEQFAYICRRALLSRFVPLQMFHKLGINHVKGLLLYGPPGTGKTLMANQIGKILNGKEPKVVRGPDIVSEMIGKTEKNIRDLFADAENDQRKRGDQSKHHVIIFDEIDAICKMGGSTRAAEVARHRIVQQLATKMDGMKALNNILLIGVTNRKDLLPEELLRPGRFELKVKFSLPDESGRLQILEILTDNMENSFLAPDVNLQELAARTEKYSGAELEALVNSSVSCAFNRASSVHPTKMGFDEESFKITMEDFLHALHPLAVQA
ncbi:unnamed protein product [Linum tenue]|uniref:Vesicle-fusing ATPase n=2 Tax=Linum tenue TaxID=586396 RepID=A0AAV0HSE3_9ROSI|nr:unnamed protein product [Linum tenue]